MSRKDSYTEVSPSDEERGGGWKEELEEVGWKEEEEEKRSRAQQPEADSPSSLYLFTYTVLSGYGRDLPFLA